MLPVQQRKHVRHDKFWRNSDKKEAFLDLILLDYKISENIWASTYNFFVIHVKNWSHILWTLSLILVERLSWFPTGQEALSVNGDYDRRWALITIIDIDPASIAIAFYRVSGGPLKLDRRYRCRSITLSIFHRYSVSVNEPDRCNDVDRGI